MGRRHPLGPSAAGARVGVGGCGGTGAWGAEGYGLRGCPDVFHALAAQQLVGRKVPPYLAVAARVLAMALARRRVPQRLSVSVDSARTRSGMSSAACRNP